METRVTIQHISGGFGNAYKGQRKAWATFSVNNHPRWITRTMLISLTLDGLYRAAAFVGQT